MRHEIPYDSTAEAGPEKYHIPCMQRSKVMLGTLFTCMATWRKRGLDPTEQLLRVFSGPT